MGVATVKAVHDGHLVTVEDLKEDVERAAARAFVVKELVLAQ